jgi:tetratricopeptide (TPR) repeat protein
MKKSIFLSYSSPQSEAATRIELSLEGEGHSVFRDRSDLPPGESFDARIRAAIEESDLFIFLISRESVSQGHYTLTELKFAEQKWKNPSGHVLPVLVEPVPKETIPEFLRAVTMLQPMGDVAAEVAAEVARMTVPRWRWFLKPQGLALIALVVFLVVAGLWQGLSWRLARREQTRQVMALVKQGELQADSGNYASAWSLLEQAGALHPASSEVMDVQERLAMEWLENARGSQLTGSLKDIADKVSPVLSRGAVVAKGERSADLLAHMGWGDFLRSREGAGGLDPTQDYRRAIEIDPGNVFAHTMWGFQILTKGGSVADANRHFAIALRSKRKREYVRHMQISALLWTHDPKRENEAIRVANEIRSGGETMPPGIPERSDAWRLWNIYYSRLISNDDKPQFLSALSPADHLATFRWLYPADQFPKDKHHLYLYVLGQLQECSGDRASALASFRQLRSELGKERGPVADGSNAAIKRLSLDSL